jgi:hypothetical protein
MLKGQWKGFFERENRVKGTLFRTMSHLHSITDEENKTTIKTVDKNGRKEKHIKKQPIRMKGPNEIKLNTNLGLMFDDLPLLPSSVRVQSPRQDDSLCHCPIWKEVAMVQPLSSPPCQPPLQHARHRDAAVM